MTQTWTSSFPDLTGWTQDPHNGSITGGIGTVTVEIPAGEDGSWWDAAAAYAPKLTHPLAGLGLSSTATYLIFAISLDINSTDEYDEQGFFFLYKDDGNFFGGSGLTPVPEPPDPDYITVHQLLALNNSISHGCAQMEHSGYPIQLQIHWNGGTSAVTTSEGHSLSPGDAIVYFSDDSEATWTALTCGVNPVRSLGYVPTAIGLAVLNNDTELNLVTAVFGALTVTAPGLPTPTTPRPPFVGHRFNLNTIQSIGIPEPLTVWNQFDEHGLVVGLSRITGETNASYRRRLYDQFVHRSNSSYQGLVYAITRDLGLSLFQPLIINPKVSSSTGRFFAPDPYIKFDGSYLYLYSDYRNGEVEYQIDRFEAGGNYEHIQRLVDFINTSTYFTAETRDADYLYTRSMTILNQSNRLEETESVQMSTSFRLKHERIVPGSLLFLGDRDTFQRSRPYSSIVSDQGDYHIDHTTGIITVATLPSIEIAIRYQYTEYPWKPWASPIILHDINNDSFKVKMFNQVLQDNGVYVHGIPTELGVDIVNELLSVVPMYWGV